LSRTRRDLPNDLDLENIIEAIETVGRNELRAAESFVRLILTHLVKAVSDPNARVLGHWRIEAINWRFELLQAFTPSMRRRIDMDKIRASELTAATADLEEHGHEVAPRLAGPCPVALDDILSDDFDLRTAAADLRARPAASATAP
jgi:Domain of unknown function DUF29